jgi:hypothetical protein
MTYEADVVSHSFFVENRRNPRKENRPVRDAWPSIVNF